MTGIAREDIAQLTISLLSRFPNPLAFKSGPIYLVKHHFRFLVFMVYIVAFDYF